MGFFLGPAMELQSSQLVIYLDLIYSYCCIPIGELNGFIARASQYRCDMTTAADESGLDEDDERYDDNAALRPILQRR